MARAPKLNFETGLVEDQEVEPGRTVQDVIDEADELIGDQTIPAGIKGQAAKEWNELKDILDDFNNGILTPGCNADVGVVVNSDVGGDEFFTEEDPAVLNETVGNVTVWYHITVTSNGPGTATGVTLGAQLDNVSNDWFFFGTSEGNDDCSIDADNLLTCDFGDLEAGETKFVDLHVVLSYEDDCPDVDSNLSTTAEVATTGEDNDPDNDTDSHTIHVVCEDED